MIWLAVLLLILGCSHWWIPLLFGNNGRRSSCLAYVAKAVFFVALIGFICGWRYY